MPGETNQKKELDQSSKLSLEQCTLQYWDDPLGFAHFAYPWGQPGELYAAPKPQDWQEEVLYYVGDCLQTQLDKYSSSPIRVAVKSGHGAGKGALSSMLVHWFMATRKNPQVVVTANTGDQLSTKTWREVAIWHKRLIMGDWFTWTATKFYLKSHPETHFASAITWNAERPQAFAGTHAEDVMVIFDEASEIDDAIWEVTEGALTTGRCIWLVMGNPTLPTGNFINCFEEGGGGMAHRWKGWTVDTSKKEVLYSNKPLIAEWIDDYGEDSDFVRVKVTGEKPNQAVTQFIAESTVVEAENRWRDMHEDVYKEFPIVFGLDVAEEGDDDNCLSIRQGPYLHLCERHNFPGDPTPVHRMTKILIANMDLYHPAMVFIDGIGLGLAVYEELWQLGYRNIMKVKNSWKPFNEDDYLNVRCETYDKVKRWLVDVGAIGVWDGKLHKELIAATHLYQKGKLRLEEKKFIKKRLRWSPDAADSLALTFYQSSPNPALMKGMGRMPEAEVTPYDYATLYDGYEADTY
ncbi:MAG: hypothetical protein V3W19_15255 [Desulfatiglandales bacterium]